VSESAIPPDVPETAPAPPRAPESTSADESGEPPPSAAQGTFVRLMIFVTALLTITMVGLLTFRWFTIDEPTSYVQIEGDASLDGVEARIDGGGLPRPLLMMLTEGNAYRARFFLQPGRYTVHILRGERELRTSQVEVYAQQMISMDLTHIKFPDATTRPHEKTGGVSRE
jgi:hypothetical protein